MRTDSRELLAVGIFGSKSRLGDRIEILLRRGRVFSPQASAASVFASTVVLSGLVLAGSLAPRWIAFAQQQPRPSFEVISVKPDDPKNDQVCVCFEPPGRFFGTNATVQMLIAFAYNARNHQISGGPDWLTSARFNIDARVGREISIQPDASFGPQALRLMVQSLLAERFRLAAHKETREEQVYELVVEKGGPRLKAATDSLKGSPQGIGGRGSELTGMSAGMLPLANELSQRLGRSVIDKTGLTEKYDFQLKWTPDLVEQNPGRRLDEADGLSAGDLNGPSIFTALQEQLGLRLQSAKGPVEILVIDHVEKPDAN